VSGQHSFSLFMRLESLNKANLFINQQDKPWKTYFSPCHLSYLCLNISTKKYHSNLFTFPNTFQTTLNYIFTHIALSHFSFL
jgi:hypothetical protein